MPAATPAFVSAAVEGVVGEAVLRRLIGEAGAILGVVYGKQGKQHLRRQLGGYNQAARLNPWVLLVDLNHDGRCAPELRSSWIPDQAPQMCFRIAVREVESWLLADVQGLAQFLRVARARVPSNPEGIDYPKRIMVDLAGRSRSRAIREDMVPRPGANRSIGPAYSSRLIQFVQAAWRPVIAEANSDSLRRCRRRLCEFLERVS